MEYSSSVGSITSAEATPGKSEEGASLSLLVKDLARLSPLRSAFELANTWFQVGVILVCFTLIMTWWALVLAFVLIGARQYALLILLHDASHTLLHPKRKVNDMIALWLIAAPCGSSYVNSRRLHLSHHRNLGTGTSDPDFFFYASGAPYPKNTVRIFFSHFVKLLLGKQIVHTLFKAPSDALSSSRSWKATIESLFPVAAVQLLLLGAFALLINWYFYFLLWVLPLVTLAIFFNGVRTFADHANVHGDVLDEKALLVTYASNPLERFFIAPYHMNYHAEHHYFPFVPHYNLPKLRALLRESKPHRDQIQWRRSYIGFIREYLRALRR